MANREDKRFSDIDSYQLQEPFHDEGPHHIETSSLICREIKRTGF